MYRIFSLISVSLLFAACGGDNPETTQPEVQAPAVPLPGEGIVAYSGAAIWDGTGVTRLFEGL